MFIFYTFVACHSLYSLKTLIILTISLILFIQSQFIRVCALLMVLIFPGVPDFGLHGQFPMPPVPADPFWPGLGFPHVFAGLHPSPAVLGLPWPPQDSKASPQFSMPSFHALLSQYMLAGGAGLPVPPGFPIANFVGGPGSQQHSDTPRSRSVSPVDLRDRSKSPRSPRSRSDDDESPNIDSGEESRKNSIEVLRIRAKEHLLLSGGQQVIVNKSNKVQT